MTSETRDLGKLLAEQNEQYARNKRDLADYERKRQEHEALFGEPRTPREELRHNFDYTRDQLSGLHSLIEKNRREVLTTIKAARDFGMALIFGIFFALWYWG